MIRRRYFIFLPLTLTLLFFSASGADSYDIDKEITRIRKELSSLSTERQKVREKAKLDFKEHENYRQQMRKRFSILRTEIDSLKKSVVDHRLKNDSLSTFVNAEINKQRQYDLLQDSFRKQLIALCDIYLEEAADLPPMSENGITSVLSFLRSELSSKSVDNIEGIQRLVQVLKDFEALTGSIQIVQGASPVPEIRGTTYRLRLGSIFEAAVDANAVKYAVWDGVDSIGNDQWEVFNDAEGAAKILKAVNIREGKALPAFVEIPFSMTGEKVQ